jgi:hypothetical protein
MTIKRKGNMITSTTGQTITSHHVRAICFFFSSTSERCLPGTDVATAGCREDTAVPLFFSLNPIRRIYNGD